jgi:hypothetical protein
MSRAVSALLTVVLWAPTAGADVIQSLHAEREAGRARGGVAGVGAGRWNVRD